jgi:hypothetical protein
LFNTGLRVRSGFGRGWFGNAIAVWLVLVWECDRAL